MTCANHPEVQAMAYCRSCGKALCEACQKTAQGTIFCEEHLPAPAAAASPGPGFGAPPADSPYTARPSANPPGGPNPHGGAWSPDAGVSPGLAFILGWIPGVGAIYNGQYAKGLIHVLVFGLLVSIVSSGAASEMAPLFGIMIAAWFPYMAFEAYHTARKRQLGQAVDEFSSIMPMRGGGRFPVAPVIFIAVGIFFLLLNFDLLRFRDIVRYWPVTLIAVGVYMLYVRLAGAPVHPEVSHEER